MKTKAIIFDLDGTAVDSPGKHLPSKRLIRAVRQLQNDYYLCSATGRVWTFVKPVLSALELTDPCVISAGTQICDPRTGKILWQKTIPEAALAAAVEVLKHYEEYNILYNDNDGDAYYSGGGKLADFAPIEPVYYLEQIFVPDRVANEIYKKLGVISGITCIMVTAQRPGTRDLHIINAEATKEHAIAELLKRIHIHKNDTIGIGDSHNDIHLFHAVGHAVAMGNAISELKDSADEVIGSVTEDGLADYFEKLAKECRS